MAQADDDVKLMLDAYQMCVSACLQHADVSLLRSQMAGRLSAVRPSAFQVLCWHHIMLWIIVQLPSGNRLALLPGQSL